ncbi:MAG: molecular chaperone DnaJ [Chloroflexota bacterium]
MASNQDYYQILGVSRSASDVEIKRAFRNAARKYHPDVNSEPGAEQRFKELSQAYQVLSDGQKRAHYDRFGSAQPGDFAGFSDIGGFADIFETFFGGGRPGRRSGPQRGADLRYDVSISFEEAAFGTEKKIDLPVLEPCESCGGSGAEHGSLVTCSRCNGSGELRRVQQGPFGQFVSVMVCQTCQGEGQVAGERCRHCRGQGQKHTSKELSVTIPPGVDNGQQIRLSGEGEAGPRGGPRGDLYVVLSVADHSYFRREGYDLYYDLPLNIAQAALGETVKVPTLEGETELRVPPGTQHDHVFRMRGKGIQRLRSRERGDLFVVAQVATPTKLNSRQRELLEELAKELTSEDDRGLFNRVKEAFGS